MTSQAIPAKKHLSQNFLVNPSITERILMSVDLSVNDTIVEIGPGKGALTRHLPQRAAVVYAVEKDSRLADHLKEELAFDNLHIVTNDFLKMDLPAWGDHLKILGNIPYHLSTPIVEKLIASRKSIKEAYLTVQKEFAKRLTAKSGTKDYGALSCYLQYYADTTRLFDIHPQNFRPVPQVFSSLIRITFRPPEPRIIDEERLFKLIRHAFIHRRKKIGNALGGIMPREKIEIALKQCAIPKTRRPDQIEVFEYASLVNILEEMERKEKG